MEAGQPAQLTGTNRSNALDPGGTLVPPQMAGSFPPENRPRAAARPARGRLKDASSPRPTHNPQRTTARDTPGTTPRDNPRGPGQPGGHGEGPSTRSHPELGRENPQRRWYCRTKRRKSRSPPGSPVPRIALTRPATRSRPGRAWPHRPRRPARRHTSHPAAGWKSPVARQAHNRCETRRTQCGVERSAALVEQRPRAGGGPGRRNDAGWSSPVARQAHNLKVVGSNPTPATK